MSRQLVVGIGYTKRGPIPNIISSSFQKAVADAGDIVYAIKTERDCNQFIKKCDLTISCSDYNRHSKSRHCSIRKKLKQGPPRIIVDTGFLKNQKGKGKQDQLEGYHSMGFDGSKGLAKFFNKNSPSDRWEQLGIDLKPWKTNGDYILLLLQPLHGIATQHINIVKAMERFVKEIKQYTKLPIVACKHPNQKNIVPKNCEVSNKTLHQLLPGAKLAVGYSTNAIIDSMIEGVPILTLSAISALYLKECSKITDKSINEPYLFDRLPYLYDLAFAQWSIKECQTGEVWKRYRKLFIENYESV